MSASAFRLRKADGQLWADAVEKVGLEDVAKF
jgi:hypothetical protein